TQDPDPLVALAEKAVDAAERQAPERQAETTMELLLPSPAGEAAPESASADGEQPPQGSPAPGHETRTGGASGHDPAEGEAEAAEPAPLPQEPAEAEHQRTPDEIQEAEEHVTAKGLPKRTPRITAPATAPRQRSTSVDAEELRRRLGGFHRGAKEGHRDVEAEIADQKTGGTVEEASS
ncbi:histidine kinase, partial [Streptomyces sp. NTH33]